MTTPQPPQGGNPFAQQPPPGGATPQPSPHTNQGGGFPPPAPQPTRGRGGKKALRSVIGIVVAIAIAVGLYLFNKSDTESSAVGDCFENTGSDFAADMKKTDCTASNAEYEVMSKHEDTTDDSKCTEGQVAYTETVNGKPSLLLCLKPLK